MKGSFGMNLKKKFAAGFIFILTLAGILISLSNYASKAEESHQAAEEIVDGEESRNRTQDEQEEEIELLLPEATDSVTVKGSDSCFTYEELPDGTLRITGYDE